MLRRHDLLKVEPDAWEEMLCAHPALRGLPPVRSWAGRGWPVMVRRRMEGDSLHGVPAALPLPPNLGRRRIAFGFPELSAVAGVRPVLLSEAMEEVPDRWRMAASELLEVALEVGMPRIFGGLLWQRLTGLPYLTASSDLDLLWSVSAKGVAQLLVERLARIDKHSGVRIDGELELPDGAAFNWRELAGPSAERTDEVLVKTLDGVELRSRARLFSTAEQALS